MSPRRQATRQVSRRQGALGALAVVLAGAWPVAYAAWLLAHSAALVNVAGDQALLELGAMRAWELHKLMGPYSRFGWHHPGPALYYLLALPVHLLSPSAAGLYVGNALVTGAAAVGTVAYIWRRYGAAAALWAATVVNLLSLSLSVGVLGYPWNPYVVIVPLVAFSVLWADALRGRLGALGWCLVVASFTVQTDIGNAPYALLLCAIAAGACGWWALRGPRSRLTRPGPAFWSGVAVTLLAWLPPAVELVRDHPDNLALVMQFFLFSPHRGPSQLAALRAALAAMTSLPFYFRTTAGGLLVRSIPSMVAGSAGMVAVAVGGWVVARRRRQPAAATIVTAGAIEVAVAIAAATRVVGPLLSYVLIWAVSAPAVLLIGAGTALLAGRPAVTGPGLVTLACLAVPVAGWAVAGALVWPPPYPVANTAVASMSAAARAAVPDPGSHPMVEVTIRSRLLWPEAAGMVVNLHDAGVQTEVSPPVMLLYFGHGQRARRPPAARFYVYDPASSRPERPPGRVISSQGGLAVSVTTAARRSRS
ncbi:MAG: hypothetical protein ACYDH5_06065 [Acidimicrobiales bacterium]